jgi:predicted Zn-dependent protease
VKTTAVRRSAFGVRRVVLACAGAALVVAAPATQEQDSPLVAAMKDELARSMKELRIKDEPPPYYIEYHVDETVTMRTAARLGATEVDDRDSRLRTVSVEVRVGDYQFDSSRFVVSQGRGGYTPQGEGSAVTTLDDNYDAIRRQLWLATDTAYKNAVNTFARKKAAFQNRATTDPLDDFSKAAPVTTVRPRPPRPASPIDWAQRARELSAALRSSPQLQSSAVSVAEQYGTHYFLNSEGFLVVMPIEDATFVVSADTQADDGMTLRASYRLSESRLEHMPPLDALMTAVRGVGDRLTAERTAPLGEEFTGPVLFEGRAGAEVLAQSFVPLLLATRAPDSDNPRFARQPSTPFLTRIGLRVMAESFSVSDTPSLTRFGDQRVPGAYEVDDEGVLAKDVPLVENGRLLTLLTNRTPNRNLPESNGHGRGNGPQAGVVQIRSSRAIPAAEMKKKYLDLLRVQNKEFGYIVRSLDTQSSPLFFKVTADGTEQMVRGVNLTDVPPNAFRDILEASSELTLHTYRTGGGPVSVIAPALLFEELEVEEVSDFLQKPPIVPSPLF